MPWWLQFIDNVKYTARSCKILYNDLAEEIHRVKCKFGCNNKKCETCGIKYKNWECYLEWRKSKDNLIQYKCLCLR